MEGSGVAEPLEGCAGGSRVERELSLEDRFPPLEALRIGLPQHLDPPSAVPDLDGVPAGDQQVQLVALDGGRRHRIEDGDGADEAACAKVRHSQRRRISAMPHTPRSGDAALSERSAPQKRSASGLEDADGQPGIRGSSASAGRARPEPRPRCLSGSCRTQCPAAPLFTSRRRVTPSAWSSRRARHRTAAPCATKAAILRPSPSMSGLPLKVGRRRTPRDRAVAAYPARAAACHRRGRAAKNTITIANENVARVVHARVHAGKRHDRRCATQRKPAPAASRHASGNAAADAEWPAETTSTTAF